MSTPKYSVGDKVIQTVYQENGIVMRTTGTIELVENEEYPDIGFLYWMHLDERVWYYNGNVLSRCKMTTGSGAVCESELEKVG